MPYCKFCMYCNPSDFDKYGCVKCSRDGKYWYKVSNINNCHDYTPSSRSAYNDEYNVQKGINSYAKKHNLDKDKAYDDLTNNSNCFITTATCIILGYRNNSKVLVTLRHLRDNYMIGKEEYNDLLVEYNIIGPIISMRLLQEKDSKKMARDLYNKYLLPASILTINGNYDKAVNYYILMVNDLKKRYNLENIKIEYDENYTLKNKEDFKKILVRITK